MGHAWDKLLALLHLLLLSHCCLQVLSHCMRSITCNSGHTLVTSDCPYRHCGLLSRLQLPSQAR